MSGEISRRSATSGLNNARLANTRPANTRLAVTKLVNTTYYGLVRLLATGAIDTKFQPALSIGGQVFNVLQEASGSLLVSVWDARISHHTLVRLAATGVVDHSFTSLTFWFNQDTYYSYTERPDKKIVVWGSGLFPDEHHDE